MTIDKSQFKIDDVIEHDLAFDFKFNEATPGFIAGVASTDEIDLHEHKVMPGAFDASIRQKGLSGPRGIKLLIGHDWYKGAGRITNLETKNDKLLLEAQLNLNVGYVKDIYEIAKQNDGLSFSVGFRLKDFKFAEDEATKQEILVVERGDLMEVSIVMFPALPAAEMTFIKNGLLPKTLTDFEKALVAEGYCRNRSDAHRFTLVVKNSLHLFKSEPLPGGASADEHPWLDVTNQLMASHDLTTKVKSLLSHSPT